MDLFSKLYIGEIELKNRIIMAPMTRCRAIHDECANDLMAEYYAQRASAGLIVAEATQISSMGIGYPCTPGIYKDKHISAWKKITSAVHKKGGLIFLQLWHTGRVSHSSFLGGATPIAPSPIKLDGEHFTYNGFQPYETPRMLEIYEIHEIVKEFTKAAQNAIQAGFDGIEIHGANGYLIDQFLKDGSNKRNDEYGGMIENRSRFLFEIIESICSAIGSHRTAIRLSPSGTYNGMTDSNPLEDFQYICTKLNNYNLAYLHIMNVLSGDLRHGAKIVELKQLREVYKGTLIANGEYTKETANNAIENNLADAISFGTLFISNPNLPLKFSLDAPLISPDSTKFYTQDEKGYTDYPSL